MVTVSIADYIIYTPLLIIDNNYPEYLHNRKNIRIFALRKHDATARVQNQITRQEENSVVNDGFFLTAFCGNGIIHSFESVVMVKVFKKH